MTVAFDPERLRLAREDAGLRKVDLAGLAGVSPAAITQFESGKAAPKASTLAQIALACGFPIQFFRVDGRPTRPRDAEQPFFRSLRSTRQWERVEAEAKATMVWRLGAEFERFVELPLVRFDDYTVAETARLNDIEEIASAVRKDWGLERGPAPNLIRLLETRGALVARVKPRSERVDAFSQLLGGRPVVMLWTRKEDAARSRFDAAHELGHLLMHPDPEPGNQALERQAHRFAAAFLMPAADVRGELPRSVPRKSDQRQLLDLKRHWGVSVAALLYRSRELQVMSEAVHRQSMIKLSSWGWRSKEPEVISYEQPTVLARALSLLEDQGVTDRSNLATALSIPVERLEEICGHGRPRVSSVETRVIELRPDT